MKYKLNSAISKNKQQRNHTGISLTELLVGTLLIGTTLAVLAEFVTGLTIASGKLNNQFDAQSSLRNAISRIKNDVRAARTIGDSYATSPSLYFPGPGNWLYTSVPNGGWPANWGSTPYQINAQTLILQVPALLANSVEDGLNGVPLKIKEGTSVNGVTAQADMEDLDTVVYKVVQDESVSNIYSLQCARFPGSYNQSKAINPPQTLVKGIIGPLSSSSTGVPEIFSYILKTDPTTILKTPSSLAEIDGIRVDIEVRRPISKTDGNANFQRNASAHAEVFPRWNRM